MPPAWDRCRSFSDFKATSLASISAALNGRRCFDPTSNTTYRIWRAGTITRYTEGWMSGMERCNDYAGFVCFGVPAQALLPHPSAARAAAAYRTESHGCFGCSAMFTDPYSFTQDGNLRTTLDRPVVADRAATASGNGGLSNGSRRSGRSAQS